MASPFAFFFAGVATVSIALGAGFAGSLIVLSNPTDKVPASGYAKRQLPPALATAPETTGASKGQSSLEPKPTSVATPHPAEPRPIEAVSPSVPAEPEVKPSDNVTPPSDTVGAAQIAGGKVNTEMLPDRSYAPSAVTPSAVAGNEQSQQKHKQFIKLEQQRKQQAAAKRKAEARKLAAERKKRDLAVAAMKRKEEFDNEEVPPPYLEREPRLRLFGLFGD